MGYIFTNVSIGEGELDAVSYFIIGLRARNWNHLIGVMSIYIRCYSNWNTTGNICDVLTHKHYIGCVNT